MMRILLLLGFLILTVSGFDVIRNLFKGVDYYAHPCDDFYRHACPQWGGVGNAITGEYNDVLRKLEAKQENHIWENMEIKKFIDNALIAEVPQSYIFIADLFLSRCEDGHDNQKFLDIVLETAFGITGDEPCYGYCMSHLNFYKNCTRAAELLKTHLIEEDSQIGYRNFASFVEPVKLQIQFMRTNIHGANIILDGELEKGVEVVNDLLNRIVERVTEWIQVTPWVTNNELVESITETINQVHLNENYALVLRDYLEPYVALEHSYLKCLSELVAEPENEYLCFMYASNKMKPVVPTHHYFNYNNAHILHPVVEMSFYYYHMAQHIDEFAAILGSVGSVVGHEVSHTLIENAEDPKILEYFSNNSMNCIQNQYQKTCDEFKEVSCGVLETQVDENGADILGFQLAYSIFEDFYQNRLQEEYIEVNGNTITMQKLFFYAFAFSECSRAPGQLRDIYHSAPNVRANAIAQHPAFQETFQCSPDSRMMRSATDQCIIFGNGAPETRKR